MVNAQFTSVADERPEARQHWNSVWDDRSPQTIDPTTFVDRGGPTHRHFVSRLDDVEDENVLELGSGPGHLAVYLAQKGAHVTAIDVSPEAVEVARKNARHNDVAADVTVRQGDALDIGRLSRSFDQVTGRFVLHHVEPFEDLVDALDEVLAPNGRGLFLENSARSDLLMWCRRHLAGRFGIPKYGDEDEHPLSPREVQALRRPFDVQVHVPEMVFFKMLIPYVLAPARSPEELATSLRTLDDMLHRWVPALRRYSYRQVVEITAT
ncbi:class I SAM-dependent methyltransferase [Longibacter sp.]|uniref:class I SAM-dependent methyltransferase n=1 Tax=Longibacter sp. TaxID=2045415 RepID=UPI003EBE7646